MSTAQHKRDIGLLEQGQELFKSLRRTRKGTAALLVLVVIVPVAAIGAILL